MSCECDDCVEIRALRAEVEKLRWALTEIGREAREMDPRKTFTKAALDSLMRIDRLVADALATEGKR